MSNEVHATPDLILEAINEAATMHKWSNTGASEVLDVLIDASACLSQGSIDALRKIKTLQAVDVGFDDMCIELARLMLEDNIDVELNGNKSLIGMLGLKSAKVRLTASELKAAAAVTLKNLLKFASPKAVDSIMVELVIHDL